MLPDRIEELSLSTSAETTAAYAALTHDFNPLHVDEAFAAATPFGGPIAHGTMALNLLLNAIAASLGERAGDRLEIRFSAPVRVGARITADGERVAEGYAVRVRTDDGTEALRGVLRLGPRD